MLTTSTEAYHAIQTLTPHQQHVLGCIAMNEDGGLHPRTVQALLTQGLIEATTETLGGRWPVTVTRYHTPVFVHLAYCAWASAQDVEEDAPDAAQG
jgi:hypothetical protein